MKRTKKVLSAITAAALAVSLSVSAFAATKSQAEQSLRETAGYLYNLDSSTSNSAITAVFVSGIDAGNLGSDYVAGITADVRDNGGVTYAGSVSALSTAAAVLNFAALGEDYTDVAGVNLVSVLENESDWTGLAASSPYGTCTALKAATLAGASDECADSIINALLTAYTEEGDAGFDYWGVSADTNAKYIEALAPYCATNERVKEVVAKSLETIESYLVEGVGYKYNLDNSWGEPLPNADSTGLVLAAYSALGDEKKADEVYTLLQNFYVGDGAYGYTDNSAVNNYATVDAASGLTAYYQFKSGISEEPSVKEEPAVTKPAQTKEEPAVIGEEEKPSGEGEKATEESASSAKTGDISASIAAAVLVMSAAAAIVSKKRA